MLLWGSASEKTISYPSSGCPWASNIRMASISMCVGSINNLKVVFEFFPLLIYRRLQQGGPRYDRVEYLLSPWIETAVKRLDRIGPNGNWTMDDKSPRSTVGCRCIYQSMLSSFLLILFSASTKCLTSCVRAFSCALKFSFPSYISCSHRLPMLYRSPLLAGLNPLSHLTASL